MLPSLPAPGSAFNPPPHSSPGRKRNALPPDECESLRNDLACQSMTLAQQSGGETL